MPTFHTVAGVAALVLGCVLVYLGTFLYETTENRIQNWLEDFWLSSEYDKRSPVGIARRLTRAVVIVADRIFDRLFGGSDLSALSICVAWCFASAGIGLSFVPLFLFAALADIESSGISKALVFSLQVLTTAAVIAFVLGLLPALHRSLRWRPTVMFVLYPLAAPMSLWAVALVAFVMLASILLLHVWLWPVVKFALMKTTYAAQRHRLIRQHTKVRAAGLSLLTFAIGDWFVAWLK